MPIKRFIKPKGKLSKLKNNYKFNYIRIGGYYRGVFPSMVRSSIINATELTSYFYYFKLILIVLIKLVK